MTPQEPSYRTIPLTQGYEAIVDAADYGRLSAFSWSIALSKRDGQIVSIAARASVSGRSIYMHRFLLGVTDCTVLVDHKNRNGLDNRRSNLRLCTNRQNQANAKRKSTNTSGFRGVWQAHGRWGTSICTVDGPKYLGTFDTREQAARVYDDAAKMYHGEFANLNFPKEGL